MPDTPPNEAVNGLGALFGTALVFITAAYGAFMAKRAKKEAPPTEPESAGVVMGLVGSKIQQEILDETRRTADGVHELVEIKHAELEAEKEKAERAADEAERQRLERIESRQGNVEHLIAELLKKLDEREREQNDERRRSSRPQIGHRDRHDRQD